MTAGISVPVQLPPNIWLKIFIVVVRRGRGCYRLVCRMRETLMHVCMAWRAVVRGHPGFWTQLRLKSYTSVDSARTSLECSGTQGIAIRLDLSATLDPAKPVNTELILHELQKHFHRVSILTVAFGTEESFQSFRSSFQSAELSRLSSFNVIQSRNSVDQPSSPRILAWGVDIFPITSLRLQRAMFGLTWNVSFSRLKILVLRDLAHHLAPLWTDYETLFSSAFLVEKICVRNVGCRGLPEKLRRFPVLRYLNDFDLSFGPDTSFEHVLLAMRAPALKTFNYFGMTDEESEALVRSGSILAPVKVFIFGGQMEQWGLMTRIFLHAPSLVLLEVLSAEQRVLEAMIVADSFVTDRLRVRVSTYYR
ncbi:hypothetical protein C8F04DRAFT_1192345 [Mycena alexandri]|uniref:F-box domain-containing protein n=1 Tax=Mycena alexandri TaxID=1745969 RepID=A0AAD6WT99_9AGAR|nr:hypothetical protein C8F04DRAFT_1192345 [Mycena alexandri]